LIFAMQSLPLSDARQVRPSTPITGCEQ
jgi:hypothetical protein